MAGKLMDIDQVHALFTEETRAAWDRRAMAKAVIEDFTRRNPYGWVDKLSLDALEGIADIIAQEVGP